MENIVFIRTKKNVIIEFMKEGSGRYIRTTKNNFTSDWQKINSVTEQLLKENYQ